MSVVSPAVSEDVSDDGSTDVVPSSAAAIVIVDEPSVRFSSSPAVIDPE